MERELTREISKGILNYPILFFSHFHQKFVYDEVLGVCSSLFDGDAEESIVKIDCSYLNILHIGNNSTNETDSFEYIKHYLHELAAFIRDIRGAENNVKPICFINNVDVKLLKDPRFSSLLHEFVNYYESPESSKFKYHTIIISSPSGELPPYSIASVSYIIPIKPPTEPEILNELRRYKLCAISPEVESKYVRALQGMHLYDIRQIIQSTINTYGKKLTSLSVTWAHHEKQQIVRKTGILEVVNPDVCLKDVGGLDVLREDIENTAKLYQNLNLLHDARIPIPKGFLLLGMPGCGKSMIAKATANKFQCPLLKLDMGRLLGKYVGESEHNLQIALDVVDSAHPCVLWIDEIEKAFAGTNNPQGDGDPVMMRLMGKFLSWMQERTTAVFIMATANDVLKPELMRKGRFDEVYFVDFPSMTEAKGIIIKTIEKYGVEIQRILMRVTDNENGILDELAKELTTYTISAEGRDVKSGTIKDDVSESLNRCLSGAEIKAYIDSFVSKLISELITAHKGEPSSLSIDNISYCLNIMDEKCIKEAKESAMINQKSPKSKQYEILRNKSFIDKIYEFKENYKFKDASVK